MTFNAHMVELEFAARTDTGKVRKRNEDAIAVSEQHGIAILADGMGGYNAGDVASSIAVASTKEALESRLPQVIARRWVRSARIQALLVDAVQEANHVIHAAAHASPRCTGMGTTIVAALFHRDRVIVTHAGDSRLYRWRDGVLTRLTHDHSLMQEQIDAGLATQEEARLSPNRNLITRALGVEASVTVDIHEFGTMADDLYLLCSDGLSDMLPDTEIADLLSQHRSNIAAAADVLIQCANIRGGHDNVSVILVAVRALHIHERRGIVGRLLSWPRQWMISRSV